MSRWYLDTSAALKLLIEEPESAALAQTIDAAAPELVACFLLETELRRVAHRDQALTQESVSTFLAGIDLYELPVSLFQEAVSCPDRNFAHSMRCTWLPPSASGRTRSSPTTRAWPTRLGAWG